MSFVRFGLCHRLIRNEAASNLFSSGLSSVDLLAIRAAIAQIGPKFWLLLMPDARTRPLEAVGKCGVLNLCSTLREINQAHLIAYGQKNQRARVPIANPKMPIHSPDRS
jgi:hypothetical protein